MVPMALVLFAGLNGLKGFGCQDDRIREHLAHRLDVGGDGFFFVRSWFLCGTAFQNFLGCAGRVHKIALCGFDLIEEAGVEVLRGKFDLAGRVCRWPLSARARPCGVCARGL